MRLKKLDNGNISFYCEGCNKEHEINHLWNFNGKFDYPTISPSVLVVGTIPTTDEEMDRIMNGENVEPRDLICHSLIKDGKINFLDDCTHELAGQTIESI